MNVLTEKTPQHLYIEYVYSDKHDKNLIEFKKKRRTILLSCLIFKKCKSRDSKTLTGDGN